LAYPLGCVGRWQNPPDFPPGVLRAAYARRVGVPVLISFAWVSHAPLGSASFGSFILLHLHAILLSGGRRDGWLLRAGTKA